MNLRRRSLHIYVCGHLVQKLKNSVNHMAVYSMCGIHPTTCLHHVNMNLELRASNFEEAPIFTRLLFSSFPSYFILLSSSLSGLNLGIRMKHYFQALFRKSIWTQSRHSVINDLFVKNLEYYLVINYDS